MDNDSQSPSVAKSTVVRLHTNGDASTFSDDVAVEEPLEIRIGNRPFVVTMRTPGNDEELAVGFMTTEGVTRAHEDFKEISRCKLSPNPENTIRLRLASHIEKAKLDSQRHGAISASCGVCGKNSFEDIRSSFPDISSSAKIDRNVLLSLPGKLRDNQVVFGKTGGLHSSGIFNTDGKLICLHEDVGRHNALDKSIGFAVLNQIWPLDNHILMLSGRVSFEIIQKALAAKIPIVAAVSAPSSLAIAVARDCGITLIGFLRDPTMNIYSHPQRVSG